MKILLALFVVLGLFNLSQAWLFFSTSGRQQAEADVDPECIDKARDGDCGFYACFDQRHHCESNNYALSYGLPFCQKYDNHFDDFTREGQEWIENTRECVMKEMLEFYQAEYINCEDVEAEMKQAHSTCEMNHGICDVDMLNANREPLHQIYLANPTQRTLIRLLYTVRQCGVSGMQDFIDWMLSQLSGSWAALSGFLDSLGELDIEFPFKK